MGYFVEATDGSGYARNALVFETRQAAEMYAKDLWRRWTSCQDTRIVESDEEPTLDSRTVKRWEERP